MNCPQHPNPTEHKTINIPYREYLNIIEENSKLAKEVVEVINTINSSNNEILLFTYYLDNTGRLVQVKLECKGEDASEQKDDFIMRVSDNGRLGKLLDDANKKVRELEIELRKRTPTKKWWNIF